MGFREYMNKEGSHAEISEPVDAQAAEHSKQEEMAEAVAELLESVLSGECTSLCIMASMKPENGGKIPDVMSLMAGALAPQDCVKMGSGVEKQSIVLLEALARLSPPRLSVMISQAVQVMRYQHGQVERFRQILLNDVFRR